MAAKNALCDYGGGGFEELRSGDTLNGASGGGSSTPASVISSSCFETSGRYDVASGGSGTRSFNNDGLNFSTGATGTSYSDVDFRLGIDLASFNSFNPRMTLLSQLANAGSTAEAFQGLGNPNISGTAITWTAKHIGFECQRASSASTWYATNADGSTQTHTSFTNSSDTDMNEYFWIRSSSNVKFYLNGVLQVTHTTNIPSASVSRITFCVTNKATASNTGFTTASFTLAKDAY